LPDHWQRLAEALDSRPSCRLAYAITAIIKEDGTDGGAIGWPHHRLRLLAFPQLHMMAALFHRSLIDEGVRFDESLPIFEDHDFLIQCACHTEFAFVDKVTSRWFGYGGTSGAGLGGNNNAPLVQETLTRIHRKWARVKEEWSNTADGLLHLGLSAAQEGRAAEASALLDRAVDRARDDVGALDVAQSILLGKHALQRGRLAEALTLLERGLETAPNDVNALNLGGMANFYAGNLQRAEALLLRARDSAPEHPGIRENVRLVQARLRKP
jgi:tetratricopeptide (TPR) repeat protein